MISDSPMRPLERLSSGSPGLDKILNGGFLQFGIYILRGTPGAGKTILGNQIAFTHAAKGGQALYVTLLAESHARMMQHLGGLQYFDAGKVASSLNYISGFRELEQDGLKGLTTLTRREIARTKATVVIVDGLVSVGERALSPTEYKKFIHELQTVASLSGCTMFLLTSGVSESVTPEQTMVDGIIELRDNLVSAQAMRTLEVSKFRGSSALRGLHTFRITDEGIVVYPRFEAFYGRPSSHAGWTGERMSTGIAALDKAMDGGLPRASTTVVLGPSGSGKTSLGLQFLSAEGHEEGMMFGFYEPPERLLGKAQRLGLDLGPRVERGKVELVWNPATESLLDELAHQLIDLVGKRKPKRLVIDAIGGFETAAAQPNRISHFFTALTNELKAQDVTTLFIMELRSLIGPEIQLPQTNVSSGAENMILLRTAEWQSRLRRTLSIVKMRDSDHDPRIRELIMTSKGITLGGDLVGAEDLMTGSAGLSSKSPPLKG